MQKLEFRVDKEKELIKAIIDELPSLSRFKIQKIIENKDVKVNNIRVKQNKMLKSNDLVTVFYEESKNSCVWYKLVYTDENIIIVNKRAGIEVISDNERDLVSILRQKYATIYPVHRIDRNTEGLVIFALNKEAENDLLSAFKTRKGLTKKYALLVEGKVDLKKIKRTVYLKKVDSLKKVWISEVKTSGYEPITTDFDIIKYEGARTLLEATLITGKTHQIRAHIAYYGYPIVGETKYAKSTEKILHLTANYLSFNFDKKSNLRYLNQKNFEIIPTWIT